jgi:hypothetical protein
MKLFLYSVGAAVTLLAGIAMSPTDAAACYECVHMGGQPPGVMDCLWPVTVGHTSCIPYTNGTCSVGSQCGGKTFLDLRLAPDGSYWTPWNSASEMLSVSASESPATGTLRNCDGVVTYRWYSPDTGRQVHEATSTLEI